MSPDPETLDPASPIIICGRGGSGSKRLLKLFDLSENTHCRNEPNALAGSEFQRLPLRRPVDPALFATHFTPALERSRMSLGVRDRLPTPPKAHHRSGAWKLQAWRILKHGWVRRAASPLLPGLRGEEWPAPSWLYHRDRLESARLVVKHGGIPTWIALLGEQRPDLYVLNIVRHLAAVISSWRHRAVPHFSPGEMLRGNRERIHQLREDFPGWGEIVPEPETLDSVGAEAWNWRFMVTYMFEAGRENPRYRRVLDEDILTTPLETARELFEFTGLPWSDAVERFILQMKDHWYACSSPWRDLLEPREIELLERVLDGSLLAGWWPPDVRVSHHDYVAF